MSKYTFAYYSSEDCGPEYPNEKGVTTNISFDESTTWDVVHREFLDFLSSVYGYDISKHVDVKTFEQRIAAFNNED